MIAILAAGLIAMAPQAPAPQCTYEDGNPDGTACIWTDPDTGTPYPVDSENYRT